MWKMFFGILVLSVFGALAFQTLVNALGYNPVYVAWAMAALSATIGFVMLRVSSNVSECVRIRIRGGLWIIVAMELIPVVPLWAACLIAAVGAFSLVSAILTEAAVASKSGFVFLALWAELLVPPVWVHSQLSPGTEDFTDLVGVVLALYAAVFIFLRCASLRPLYGVVTSSAR